MFSLGTIKLNKKLYIYHEIQNNSMHIITSLYYLILNY